MIAKIYEVDFPASEAMGRLRLRVTGLKVLGLRLKLAMAIFAFGGWVAGLATVEFEASEHTS